MEVRKIFSLLLVCGCAACSVQPDYVRPAQQLPEKFRNAPVTRAAEPRSRDDDGKNIGNSGIYPGGAPAPAPGPASPPTLVAPRSAWWTAFRSSELDRLVEKTIQNNHDLAAAVHRVAQAKAQAGMAGAALLPQMQFNAQTQANAPKNGLASQFEYPQKQSQRQYQMSVGIGYELDLWGKNRSAEAAALAQVEASEYDREALALSLTAEVVQAYFQYLVACDRVMAAENNLANMTRVLDTVEKRHTIGEGARVEVMQQRTALAQARAALPPLQINREQTRDLIALLTGELPETLELTGHSLVDLATPGLPEVMPSALLERRPDIRRDEANLIAANAGIGIARGKLLPSFDLTGQRGIASPYLSALMSPAGYFFLIAGNISATLFDAGKSLDEIDLNKEIFAERTETYRQTVLGALKDVEDALIAVRLTEEQERHQAEAFANAQAAHRMSREAFQMGTSDYLTVLDTERTLYQNEDARAQSRYDHVTATVALFRSLAGGAD